MMSSNLNFLLELIFLQKKRSSRYSVKVSSMVAGAKCKLEMIKAERQESRFSDARPVPVTAKVARGTRCTRLKEAGTPLPGLLCIFTDSSPSVVMNSAAE